MIRPPGTSIPMVSITVARLRQAGIGEARRNVCSVWSVPLRDLAPALGALGLAGLAAAAPLGAQVCREPHCRWTQKTDTTLAEVVPQPTSVAVILATWAPPHLGPRDRCAPRSDHELETYSVTAWVRRVDRVKNDGDWHIELTQRADNPSHSSILVEIPAPRYSPRYARAPGELHSLIGNPEIRPAGVLRRP